MGGIPGVSALAVFDDGSGAALYAGGLFSTAGGVAVNGIARWNGTSWSALGSGVSGGGATAPPIVRALTVFDDGSGAALYAGGNFTTAGGVAVNSIAKWNGTTWSALGSGLCCVTPFGNPSVYALTVFDDGGGAALYAGGNFASAGGAVAPSIAKWNGTSWSGIGPVVGGVSALAVFNDGSGPALYAGGSFQGVGFLATNSIAKWNGTSWFALGSGLGGSSPSVETLGVFDDGSGGALYAGGSFPTAGGVAANNIAKWNGTSWSALGGGLLGYPLAMAVLEGGGGSALYAGGFIPVSPAGDTFIAKWGCPISSVPGCAGNPAVLAALATSAPLGSPLPLRITGFAALSGLGVVAYGASGIDGSGCGPVVPPFGELLLALQPLPKTLPSSLLAGGICDLSPLVPSTPALSGVTAYLQGAAVDIALPQPIELTNALAVTLGP